MTLHAITVRKLTKILPVGQKNCRTFISSMLQKENRLY